MGRKEYDVAYPRKRFARSTVRILGRLVLPLAFRVRISGRENFPRKGPLLVVGNHVAAMEAVLMAVFTPWQVEMVSSADIPNERITDLSIKVFGSIPVRRGRADRSALKNALGVLEQGGVVGIFPEGGIWQAGAMPPKTGVAWLSYHGKAPVLPIGFSGTLGALGAALRLQRPELVMRVGQPIPAASPPPGKARKVYLEEYATRILDEVRALLPAGMLERGPRIVDERFELEVAVLGADGSDRACPAGLAIQHGIALAKFLHNPVLLKIFGTNLRLPVGPLQEMRRNQDPAAIAEGVEAILDYLRLENPHLLTYRLGPQEAREVEAGLEELLGLARWAVESGFQLQVTPVRRYYSLEQEKEIVQVEQGVFEHWM